MYLEIFQIFMTFLNISRWNSLLVSAMLIDGVPITLAVYVRNLGSHSDRDLSMRTHVQRTVSRCFAALHQLRQIRHSVPASHFRRWWSHSSTPGSTTATVCSSVSQFIWCGDCSPSSMQRHGSSFISDALVCLHSTPAACPGANRM